MAPRRVPLRDLVGDEDVLAGRVRVDGVVVTNPRSMVLPTAAITIDEPPQLRGEIKLAWALDHFGVAVEDRVALDAGASTGGFTSELRYRGAARVYAVEAGYGQLLGSLRQDPGVVNLELTNLGDLSRELVPEPIEVVTFDFSYLSLAEAIPQLDRIDLASGCDLIALVKPMFELKLANAPKRGDQTHVDKAIAAATAGAQAAGWQVTATASSPIPGARGAAEGWLHATARSDV